MLPVRRAWLAAIAGVTAIGGDSALVMRVELLDPGGTLSPTVYSHALALHALTLLGVFVAAFGERRDTTRVPVEVQAHRMAMSRLPRSAGSHRDPGPIHGPRHR